MRNTYRLLFAWGRRFWFATFCVGNLRKDMTARHQLELIYRQIRGGKDKAICICASIAKGGGNNSVTYIVELYNKD